MDLCILLSQLYFSVNLASRSEALFPRTGTLFCSEPLCIDTSVLLYMLEQVSQVLKGGMLPLLLMFSSYQLSVRTVQSWLYSHWPVRKTFFISKESSNQLSPVPMQKYVPVCGVFQNWFCIFLLSQHDFPTIFDDALPSEDPSQLTALQEIPHLPMQGQDDTVCRSLACTTGWSLSVQGRCIAVNTVLLLCGCANQKAPA